MQIPIASSLYDASDETDRAMCEKVARACIKNSRYDFVAGGAGGNFFDIDEYSAGRNDGNYDVQQATVRAQEIAQHFVVKLRKLFHSGFQINRLAFIERDTGPIGMLSYKDFIGTILEIETCCLRPRKRLLPSALKGRPLVKDEQVALISDVATSGDTILAAAEKVWQLGGKVAFAIVLFDRSEGAKEYLAQYDINLFSIFNYEAVIEAGHVEKQSSPSAQVMQFVGVGTTG